MLEYAFILASNSKFHSDLIGKKQKQTTYRCLQQQATSEKYLWVHDFIEEQWLKHFRITRTISMNYMRQ